MFTSTLGTSLLALVVSLSCGVGALAQDAAKAPASAPAAKTTADPKIPVKELQLMLTPLTKGELETELKAWMKLVQDAVARVSNAEVEAARAKDSKVKDERLVEAGEIRAEKTALHDRVNAVIDAYKAKGGKADDEEKYLAAVSGVSLDVTDASATWTTLLTWLKSPEGGIRYGKNIVLFLLTLLAFSILGTIIGRITRRTMSTFRNSSALLKDFVGNTARKVTFFVGIIVALSMLEVNIGPFLAAIGAIGFVIGFALQGTLSNFAAGVMILLYRPYDIGDTVTIAGAKGNVVSMTLVSTVLQNEDNHTIVVPNSSIWGGIITNLSSKPAVPPKKEKAPVPAKGNVA
jgi:small conductance mechanosensitive channel